MKKLEVYFSKLPKSCFECPCFKNDLEFPCGLSDGTQDFFKDEIDGDKCPLKKIQSRDLLCKKLDSLSKENSRLKAELHKEKQEIVNEVCEKIKDFCENWKQYKSFYNYVLVEEKSGIKVCPTLYDFLDQIQREQEK